jgi:hypothetical protein
MPASRFAAWAGKYVESAVTRVNGFTTARDVSDSVALDNTIEVIRPNVLRVTEVATPKPDTGPVTQVTWPSDLVLPKRIEENQCCNPGNLNNPRSEHNAKTVTVRVPEAAIPAAGACGEEKQERAAIVDRDANRLFRSSPKDPVILLDGRVMHFFSAIGEIPKSSSSHDIELCNRVRLMGVVLVADGAELHVVERWQGQLDANALRALRANAGAVIAILRGEFRAKWRDNRHEP